MSKMQTIDLDTLSTVTGGVAKTQQPDFASQYVQRLRNDSNQMYNRRVAAGNALKQHNWGAAAKNAVGYGLNAVHGAFDLVNFS